MCYQDKKFILQSLKESLLDMKFAKLQASTSQSKTEYFKYEHYT